MGSAIGWGRVLVVPLLVAGVLGVPAPASGSLATLEAACEIRDAADGDPVAGGATLPFYFCNDGLPPSGGTTPNEAGVAALEVPAAYQGFAGLPVRADLATARAVPGADSDGNVALDANLSLPDPRRFPLAASERYPLIVFMHGCCGGDKTGWEAATIDGGTNAEKWHHSNAWFASRGYAVLTYTARGFVDKDERGSTGQTELDHRGFEINDYQELTSQLVDGSFTVGGATVALDPQRVVTVGGSYGGGFSWMALTDPTWKSRGGKDMRLAASTPKYGWTDLAYSLVPNGSHVEGELPATDGSDTGNPIGFPKRSIVAGLFASGRTGVPPGTSPHATFSSEIDNAILCLQSPLPFDANPLCTNVREQTLPGFVENRSAYYQNDFFAGLAGGSVAPVPVFSAGALTDPLFPGREHRRMSERLRATVAGYPIKEYYGDYQHFVQNKRKEWSDLCGDDHHVCELSDYPGGDLNLQPPTLARAGINSSLSDFVDHYAKPPVNAAEPAPSFDVTSSLQICPSNASEAFPADEPGERFTAANFDALTPHTLRFELGGMQTTTSKAVPNTHALTGDPVANQVSNGSRCALAPGPAGPGVASYETEPLNADATMIGPTRVSVPYTATGGGELQLNARLYDVGPDGTAVMVDRGFRTLGDAAEGTAVIDLLGNGWRFPADHAIRVELAQDDDPYIRASTIPSSMSLAGVTLEIPVREASSTPAEPGPAPVVDQRADRGRDRDRNRGRDRRDGEKDDEGVRATSGANLPFTGLELGLLIGAGMLLLGIGLLARRALRHGAP